ncbi:MAG: glycoside hydrolase family 2, partial [Erysipelotrichaceae bacterium]|nr:glycoside hydrolase family 2 [Erysipelotrichaceae bacterium]
MSSKYYEQFNTGKILDEYPRPHLVRNSYLNLNGYYEYQITDNKQMPSFDPKQRILVPFPPESELSKVKRILMPDEYLYYHRLIKIPQEFGDKTLLLHFDGIDQIADIYINDEFVLKHEGGYLPFTIELSDISESFDLKIRVRDYSDTSFYSRGKQKLQRGGIWYTPISGIWKNV